MPFDPCREWLGIDATDLKDPHRVLDIPPTVTDGDTIARLAEARLAILSQIAPGPFQKAHAALLMRVAEARDRLLATATWETDDEAPEEKSAALLPPPLPVSEPSPVEVSIPANVPLPASDPEPLSDALPASALAPVSYQPPLLAEEPEPAEDDDSPYDAVPIPFASDEPLAYPGEPTQTTTKSGGGGLGLFAIFLAIMIAGGYYAYKRFGVGQEAWDVAINTVVAPLVDLPLPGEAIPTADVDQQPPDLPGQDPEPPATTSSPQQPPEPPSPPPPSEPDPETKRRIAEERARAAEFVNSSLQDAFDALKREDFDKADRAIEAASQYARDDFEAGTRVERWRLLAAYARGYADFRTRAFRAASAGRDYEIDGRLIVVIEVSPTDFTYRLAGRNYTVARKTMSPVLEVGVVEAWFAGGAKAANHFFLGARWLCKEPPNLTRARTAWQKAADGGEDAAPLMALLDDPITQEPDAR
jgi:hypothetical protein